VNSQWVAIARAWIPRNIRYWVQKHVSLTSVKLRWNAEISPYAGMLSSDKNNYGIPFPFGIVKNSMQDHGKYVAACLEMGVPFRVIDLAKSDWLDQVRRSGCEVLLVWGDAYLTIWNSMIKDRIEILERDMGITVFPTTREMWFYEDKRRLAYWLAANRIPHPQTWVFYDLAECQQFVGSCDLPVMFKASFGAVASGVRLFRDRDTLRRFIRDVFRKGFQPNGLDRRDRQWGSVLLQEYVPVAKEWRLVRIGDSFYGHVKGCIDGLHSGSGLVEWDVPEERHLNFLLKVTETGGFRSMDVDVFETMDGRLLVNELQAVFGASHSVDQMRKDGVPGRFVQDQKGSSWIFEPGDFARNACANERIRYLLGGRFGAQSGEGLL
jgi:glutathione synthase/RimK-type ligase-like ATP-grasp enzyme